MTADIHTRLNTLADRIEATLVQYHAPARITGGIVGPRLVSFDLAPAVGIRVNAIARLDQELALNVGAPNVSVRRAARGLVLEFPRADPRGVRFIDALQDAEPLPQATALLGITGDGAPLLARLSSPDVAHVLVAGTTGSGKTALLRTIAASLVLGHTPEALRLLCLDPKASAFAGFEGLPHLVRPVLSVGDAIGAALRDLVALMERRTGTGSRHPRIVVLIDELADLIMTVEGVTEHLTRLSQRGREAGIHLVAATQRPSAAVLSGLIRANFPLRLVGRVVSATDAHVASGQPGTGAHILIGRGDFLAVTGGRVIRFQAAYATTGETHRLLADWRAEPPAADVLPARVEADVEGESPGDLELLAERLAPWWASHGGRWGSKTAACRHLFGPDTRYAGYYARLTDQAIARVEA